MTSRARSPQVIEGEIVDKAPELPEGTELVKLSDTFSAVMRKPEDIQLGLLTKLAADAERNPSIDAAKRLWMGFFSIVESLLVSETDVEALQNEILARRLTMEGVMKGMGLAEKGDEEAPRRVRRASRK